VVLVIWLFIAVIVWVILAPDPMTAGARSGAAGAVSAVGQSIKAGYQSRRSTAKAKRTQKHLDRRAAWGKKDADGNHVDPWGPIKLWLDDWMSQGGRLDSAAKAAGRALQTAGSTAKQGWADGKSRGSRGLPQPVKKVASKAAVKVAERVDRHQQSTAQGQTPGSTGSTKSATSTRREPKPDGQPKPTGNNEGNPMSQSTQALSSEIGLLPIAEAMEAIVEQLAQVAVHAETAQGLVDLSFPVDENVAASIATLVESAPDPAKLAAFAEAIPAFREAVQASTAHLTGA
jgi:hypothetical protein